MKKVIKFSHLLHQAMAQLKSRKLMHKVGKQWIVIGVSTLVLSLGGVALSGTTHAANVPNNSAVKVQPRIQLQAKALHKQIINHASQGQNKAQNPVANPQATRDTSRVAYVNQQNRTYSIKAAHANENAGLVIVKNSSRSNRRHSVKRNHRTRRGRRFAYRPQIRRNRSRRANRVSYVSAYTYRSYQRQIRALQWRTRLGTRYSRRLARKSLARVQRQFKDLRIRQTVSKKRTKRVRRRRTHKINVKKHRRRRSVKPRINFDSNSNGSFTVTPSDNNTPQSDTQPSDNQQPSDQSQSDQNNISASDTNDSDNSQSGNNMKLSSKVYTSDEIAQIQSTRQRYNYLENHENSDNVSTDSDLANYRQHVVDWVNFYRTQLYNLQPVSEDSDYDDKAQQGADSNTDPEDMILGDSDSSASAPSDVDIYFTDTDDADNNGTPGHRVSVLNPRSSNVGVGVDGGRDTLYFDFGLNNNITSDNNGTITYPNAGLFPLNYANQGNEDYWGASFITGSLNSNSYPANYQHILVDDPQVTVHDDTNNSYVNVSDVHNDGSLMNNNISAYNSAIYYKVDVNQLKANHQYTITISGDGIPNGSYSYSTKLYRLSNAE